MLINLVGQCGPVLGTRLYPASQGPRYVKGMSICAGFMFFVAVVSLGLRVLLVWENSRLDGKYARENGESKVGKPEEKDLNVGIEDYGPGFRYVL